MVLTVVLQALINIPMTIVLKAVGLSSLGTIGALAAFLIAGAISGYVVFLSVRKVKDDTHAQIY